MDVWKKCCEEWSTIDPETGICQNGCGDKVTPTDPIKRLAETIYFQGKWSGTNKDAEGNFWSVRWLESLLADAIKGAEQKGYLSGQTYNNTIFEECRIARNSALEEAAKIIETRCYTVEKTGHAEHLACLIRALRSDGGKP